jgi:hypothetical protein
VKKKGKQTMTKRTNIMRKRKYTLAVLTLVTAATIAIGWATQAATLLGSERTEQTIAGSKGEKAQAGRESRIADSAGANSKAGRESA